MCVMSKACLGLRQGLPWMHAHKAVKQRPSPMHISPQQRASHWSNLTMGLLLALARAKQGLHGHKPRQWLHRGHGSKTTRAWVCKTLTAAAASRSSRGCDGRSTVLAGGCGIRLSDSWCSVLADCNAIRLRNRGLGQLTAPRAAARTSLCLCPGVATTTPRTTKRATASSSVGIRPRVAATAKTAKR
jgi:hypothetical protein